MEKSAAKNTNSNRAGALVQNLSGELEYFSFKPSPLPPEPTVQIDSQMLSLLIEANRKVAYLDAISEKRHWFLLRLKVLSVRLMMC